MKSCNNRPRKTKGSIGGVPRRSSFMPCSGSGLNCGLLGWSFGGYGKVLQLDSRALEVK